MEEKFLFGLALICSLVGILILLFVSERMEVETEKISSALIKENGAETKVTGEVILVKENPNSLLIKIRDESGSIDAFVFKNKLKVNLTRGQMVAVSGKIDEFLGKKEIKAEIVLLVKKSVKFII